VKDQFVFVRCVVIAFLLVGTGATSISGRSASRIFLTARKWKCFGGVVRKSSALQISSIEQPW
jgi:hypothetical protein